MTEAIVPRAFIWRRLHSLMGLWLMLFLIEHLLTNSQAALWLGDNGKGFVKMVNALHDLPYLQVIEILLLGIPFLIHMVWGVKYLLTAKSNAKSSDGSKPALKEYGRNRAYSWQRITSWILLIGIIGHVTKFRFIDYPDSINTAGKQTYFAVLDFDQGLHTVAHRVGATLYDKARINNEALAFKREGAHVAILEAAREIQKDSTVYQEQEGLILVAVEEYQEQKVFVETLQNQKLKENQVVATSSSFGTATLLLVRDAFKSPIYVGLYTIFVLAACFHAFNGFWTFLITWGVILNMRSQKKMVNVAIGLMAAITFLGLISIWGTYWMNLKN